MDNKKAIKRWQTAATVLSFTALGFLIFGYWIGTETYIKYVMVAVCSIMFSVAVIWWYWALSQVAIFAKYINSLKDVISDLKKDLQDIKKDI